MDNERNLKIRELIATNNTVFQFVMDKLNEGVSIEKLYDVIAETFNV